LSWFVFETGSKRKKSRVSLLIFMWQVQQTSTERERSHPELSHRAQLR
jgi:hypothetical protein